MTPELQAILNGIGYQTALRHNRNLGFHSWGPDVRGERIFKDKVEAKEGTRALQSLCEAMLDLPPYIQDLIASNAKRPEDWDAGRDPLADVMIAIGTVSQWADEETLKHWKGRGQSPRLGADDIAKKIAEIYVLGRGKMPTSGSDENGDPCGIFANAVHAVFRELKTHYNFRRPCGRAISWLKQDDEKEYNRLLDLRRRQGQSMSLITGRVQK